MIEIGYVARDKQAASCGIPPDVHVVLRFTLPIPPWSEALWRPLDAQTLVIVGSKVPYVTPIWFSILLRTGSMAQRVVDSDMHLGQDCCYKVLYQERMVYSILEQILFGSMRGLHRCLLRAAAAPTEVTRLR